MKDLVVKDNKVSNDMIDDGGDRQWWAEVMKGGEKKVNQDNKGSKINILCLFYLYYL